MWFRGEGSPFQGTISGQAAGSGLSQVCLPERGGGGLSFTQSPLIYLLFGRDRMGRP